MPITWDEKAERDLLLAMLMAGSPPGQFKAPSWATVARNMATMGYNTNQSAISQRWSKNIFHDLKQNHPNMFQPDGGADSPAAAAGAAKPAAAAAPAAGKKRGRGRPPKAKKVKQEEEEDNHADEAHNGDNDIDRPAKMQKLDDGDEGLA